MKKPFVILAMVLAAVTASYGQARFTEKPDYSRVIREVPEAMKRAGFEALPNAQLPLDAVLTNERGEQVTVGSVFGEVPVIVNFVYFNCPMMCSIILNSIADSLKQIDYLPGRDYRILTISFDHTEGHELAAAKKQTYVDYFGKPGADEGWYFFTGDEANIQTLTSTAGFTFAWDEERGEYAHASGIIVATPEGRLSHYLFGVAYDPADLRLGLVDASQGKIGTALDKAMLMFCYMYDPSTGAYSLAVFRLLKAGGALTILTIALYIVLSIRQERRQFKLHQQLA
jgi:protein SCO1/2